MESLAALIAFSFVNSVTPGPNNVLLWASGVQFGLRATMPHVVGTSVGIGAMAIAASAGVGVVLTLLPQIGLVLRAVGSVYLLYLAFTIAVSPAMGRGETARPLTVLQAAGLQWINPKAWIFVLAAVTAYRPDSLPIVLGSALVVATMMVVVVPTSAIWAGGGSVLNRLVAGERAHRVASVALAATLALTVVYLWL